MRSASSIRVSSAILALALATGYCSAQQIALAPMPDAPQPQQASAFGQSQATSPAPAHQTTLSFFPRLSVATADMHLPPQSVKEKFLSATEDNIDLLSIGEPALSAGFKQATNAIPEFGKGPTAYGRYYWHAWVDRASEVYCVEFILPVITREDTRYYKLGRSGGGMWQRTGYAISRVVVTRSDSGKETFNISEVVGAGMAGGISNLYYPSPERKFSDVAQRWGVNIGVDAASFLLREFWPPFRHSKPPAHTNP